MVIMEGLLGNSSLLEFVQIHSYLIIFILMIVEGPIVTATAAFAASLGYLDIYYIFFISFFGNFIPDSILYAVGRLGRRKSVESLAHKVGLNQRRIQLVEDNLRKHAGKALTFGKISPFLPVATLVLAGFVRMPYGKFARIDAAINAVTTIVFIIIGYFFGINIKILLDYLNLGAYVLFLIIPLIALIYLLTKWISAKFRNDSYLISGKK